MAMTSEGDKLALSSLDIRAIISACAKFGVSKLKFRDLEVEFGRTPGPSEMRNTNAQPKPPVAEITEQQHQQFNVDSLESDELELRERELSELQVTNPAKYEELVQDGELEDAESDDRDDNLDE